MEPGRDLDKLWGVIQFYELPNTSYFSQYFQSRDVLGNNLKDSEKNLWKLEEHGDFEEVS